MEGMSTGSSIGGGELKLQVGWCGEHGRGTAGANEESMGSGCRRRRQRRLGISDLMMVLTVVVCFGIGNDDE